MTLFIARKHLSISCFLTHKIAVAIVLLMYFLVHSSIAQSQAKTSIVGFLTDSLAKKSVEYATVVLLSSKDSSIVTSTVSDYNGVFEIRNITQNRYLIKVSHMSYNPITIKVNARQVNGIVNLGNVKLTRKQIALEEIVIAGRSLTTRVAKDTLEYNVSAFKAREQDVIADLLKKLPGVVVDKEGVVTVGGKPITQITVDGKTFFLNDPALAVQNLPASIVDKVQIVDKKSDQLDGSAKVDDGKKEKIINLTLKEDKKAGIFGNYGVAGGTKDSYNIAGRFGGFKGSSQMFAYGNFSNINKLGSDVAGFPNSSRQGISTAGNGGINFNYEPDSILLYNGSYKVGYSNLDREVSSNRQNYDKTGTFASDSFDGSDSRSYTNSFFSRLQYNVSPNVTYIITPSIQLSNGNSRDLSKAHLYSNVGNLVNYEEKESNRKSWSNIFGVGLRVQRKLGSPNKTLYGSFEAKSSESNTRMFIVQKNYYAVNDSMNLRDQKVNANRAASAFAGKLTYNQPLGRYFSVEINGGTDLNSEKSTNMAYDFDAALSSYSIENKQYSKDYKNVQIRGFGGARMVLAAGRFSSSVGLNGEFVHQQYKNRVGFVWLDTLYGNQSLSPSMSISYSKPELFDLSFSYSGRSIQPTIEQIKPLQNPNTPNSIFLPNPLLKKAYQHSFGISYSYFDKDSFFSITDFLEYSTKSNDIVSQTTKDDFGRWSLKYLNVSGTYRASNSLVLGKTFFNNLIHLSALGNVGYSQTPGFMGMFKYFTNQFSFYQELKLTLTLEVMELWTSLGYSFGDVRYKGLNSESGFKPSRSFSTLDLSSSLTIYLPGAFEVRSTLDASKRFSSNIDDNNSMLWNSLITKRFLKDKSLSVSVMAYDILNKYKPFSRTVSSYYIEEVRYKAVSQMFMVSLSYTLNRFKGKS